MKGWKAAQSKRKIVQRNKFALIVLGLILFLLLLSQAVKLTRMLFSPWQQSTQVDRVKWSADYNFNIVISAKGISLFSFNPQKGTITTVDIPQNVYLEVPYGFGKWLLSSIYHLGEFQKTGGGQLLKNTLINQFGLPIDGFLQFSGEYSRKETAVIVSEIRKDPFSLARVLPYLKTDLTPVELIRLKMGLSRVRFDKIEQIDLKAVNALQKDQLADGTDIFMVDPIKLDSLLFAFKDTSLQTENKTVAIFNSTDHPLLAQKAARLVTNIGGNVIIISNSPSKLPKSQIAGEPSQTKTRIKQIFEADDIIAGLNEELSLSRAEINLFLGEDFFNRL